MKLFTIISFLYSISVFCFTLYGYSKNLSESICSERRPGLPLPGSGSAYNVGYFQVYPESGENTTIFQAGDNVTCLDYGGCIKISESSLLKLFSFAKSVSGYQSFDYHFNSTGFQVDFYKDGVFDILSCNLLKEYTTITGNIPGALFSSSGFSWTGNFQENDNVSYESYASCFEGSYLQDCSFSKNSDAAFLYLSACLMATFIILLLFSFLFIKIRLLLCVVLRPFLGEKIFDVMKFCNPLNDEYSFKSKGEKIFVVERKPAQTFEDFGVSNITVKTKNYIFLLNEGRLVVLRKNSFMSIVFEGHLEGAKLNQVKNLLLCIDLDPHNWILNQELNHFLSLNDFINFVLDDEINMRCIVLEKNSIVLNLGFETFLSEISSLNIDIIKILINHNRLFFNHLNLPCLMGAVKRKFGWADRPDSVKNSEWKAYTNDVAKFLFSRGYNPRFYQMRNKDKKFTKSMTDALHVYLNEGHVPVEIQEVSPNIDFQSITSKKSSGENSINEEHFQVICDSYLKLKEPNPFSEEEMEVINGMDCKQDVLKYVSSMEVRKDKREEKMKEIEKLNRLDKEISRAQTVLKDPSHKLFKKVAEKHTGYEEVSYKRALLLDNHKKLREEIKQIDDENSIKIDYSSVVITEQYLTLVKSDFMNRLKKDVLSCKEEPKLDPEKVEKCKILSVYSSVLKRGNKSKPKAHELSMQVKIREKDKTKSGEANIELKNMYSVLYGKEDDISEFIEKKACWRNNAGGKNKKQKRKNYPVVSDEIDDCDSAPIIDFGNCTSLKKSVKKIKYDKGSMIEKCKYHHEVIKNYIDSLDKIDNLDAYRLNLSGFKRCRGKNKNRESSNQDLYITMKTKIVDLINKEVKRKNEDRYKGMMTEFEKRRRSFNG